METVEIQSTSRQTAVCSDILLREGPTVRLIFRPQLVDNPHDPDACVKGRFVYQRKGKNDEWEDVDSPPLASLKRGEYFELEIKSGELLPLLRQLGALWRFHRKQGMPKGRVELVRIGQHLAKLLELSEPELDAFLSENTSDAMKTLRRVLRWIANNPGTAEQLAANERQLPELNALVGLANLRAVLQMWSDNAENDDEEFWQGVFATHSYVLSQLPVRTFADWGDPLPGNMETDLVAHCGDNPAGSYLHTLVLTDIASGWVECVALVVREAALVVEALEGLRLSMPFPLCGLDIDNGSEFLNESLLHYCLSHGIELTRSRPYRKNDQAWVEQKNGAVVRRLVGYHRFEGLAAAEALSRLYTASRLFVNFFQPSFKLAEKTRVGPRVRKRYHAPQTPCARLLASDAVSKQVKARLREIAETLDPLGLLDEIRRMQHHLAALADGGQPHTPVSTHEDLGRFLAGLSSAWRAGEVRPTHCVKPKPPRHWRTRNDPFKAVWPQMCQWLEAEPGQTGLQLFERLQREHPGVFPDGQLRTLQRRLKDWRTQVARRLVFGGQDDTIRITQPGKISSEAAGKIFM